MKANIIGLRELRENTDHYIEKVGRGQDVIVMRKSRPVFKMVSVDEWGDEGKWESVSDFAALFPKGVSAQRLTAALREEHGQNR